MKRIIGIGLAAAAVIPVALIGHQLVGGSAVEELPEGQLNPGTRYATSVYSNSYGNLRYSFAVPTQGWQVDEFGNLTGHTDSPDRADLWFFLTSAMYNGPTVIPAAFDDPCAHDSFQAYDESLAGQAEALAAIPGTELVANPSEVTVDSHTGLVTAIAIPSDPGCGNGEYWLLFNADCGEPTLDCTNYPNWLGEVIQDWMIDVEDEIFNVRAQVRFPDEASPDLESEIRQIVDSIQFE
jgi:hypothetical protein